MLLSSPAYVISPTFSVFPWPETITVSRWRRQEIECRNEFAPSRFTRQASVFCGSAVATTGEQRSGLYVSSAGAWCTHPGAVKYITCRVMSFRPWQSSVGPLRGLSCLRGGIALILSIPTMTRPASPFISSIFLSPRSASVFGDFLFRSFHPPPSHSSSSPCPPNLPAFCFNFLRLPVHGGRHLRPACHKAPQLSAVP